MKNKLSKYVKFDKLIIENDTIKALNLDYFAKEYKCCDGGCCKILKEKLKLDKNIAVCCHYCKLYNTCNSDTKCDLEVEIDNGVVMSCEYDIYYDKEEIDEEY